MNTKGTGRGATRGAPQKRTARAELVAAQARIGPTWLYGFARRRPDFTTRLLAAPRREQGAIAWEALAFAKGGQKLPGSRAGLIVTSEERPPTWAEVTSAHFHLWTSVLTPLKTRGSCSASWTGNLFLQDDGTVTALTVTDALGFRAAFLCQAVELLREQSARGIRLRFCSQCGNPFAAKRLDAKRCSGSSCRTLAWRKAHRKEFRKQRNDAYRRKVLGTHNKEE